MPEYPDIAALKKKLHRGVRKRKIESVEILHRAACRPEAPHSLKRRIEGRQTRELQQLGKNLFLWLSGDEAIRFHLKLSGTLQLISSSQKKPTHTRVILHFDNGTALALVDPRALAALKVYSRAEFDQFVQSLGPDPLSNQFSLDYFRYRLGQTHRPIKAVLLDQRVVVGLGNIWAAEVLYRARISPDTPANQLSARQCQRLYQQIRQTLTSALQPVERYIAQHGSCIGMNTVSFFVYGREDEPCRRCRTPIRRIIIAGRSTYFCPRCQKA